MPNNITIKYIVFTLAFSFSLLQIVTADQNTVAKTKIERSIFLFRHAEKQKNAGRNPHLTEQGKKRAKNIAQQLKDKRISAIFSTDYFRTMETVKPLSKLLGIAITNYNPRDLIGFAKYISNIEGNIVVVGHSNTTPALIKILGGDRNIVIGENEYNLLFQLNSKQGEVETTILKSSDKY
ncbi:MAG: histidine phosphatase family protein [Enterobacterales bacterium]|nr:histidine phosphatase family protein [Enterobacterales bacterium]